MLRDRGRESQSGRQGAALKLTNYRSSVNANTTTSNLPSTDARLDLVMQAD